VLAIRPIRHIQPETIRTLGYRCVVLGDRVRPSLQEKWWDKGNLPKNMDKLEARDFDIRTWEESPWVHGPLQAFLDAQPLNVRIDLVGSGDRHKLSYFPLRFVDQVRARTKEPLCLLRCAISSHQKKGHQVRLLHPEARHRAGERGSEIRDICGTCSQLASQPLLVWPRNAQSQIRRLLHDLPEHSDCDRVSDQILQEP